MASRKTQAKAGIAATRRGQQMGDAAKTNNPNKQTEPKTKSTPALSGRRKAENQFFADDSQQAGGGDAARPRTVSPSVAAAVPTGAKKGEPGGERVFKQRQAKAGKKPTRR